MRFGRFDRHPWVRRARLSLMRRLARGGCAIRFVTRHGFEMLLPGDYTSLVTATLSGTLSHPKLPELLAEVVKPGDVFVDGGSNMGFYSLLVARLLRGKVRIFAFEPDPSTFGVLSENIAWNGFASIIQAEPMALAGANQWFDFWASAKLPMMSTLIPSSRPDDKKIQVSGVRLDDYLAGLGQKRVDVIKLDLEGGEPMALEGMTTSLEAARLLIFEVNEPQLAQVGIDPLRMVEDTAERGRFETVSFIDEKGEEVCSWSSDRFAHVLRRDKFVNVLCAKASVIPPSFGA